MSRAWAYHRGDGRLVNPPLDGLGPLLDDEDVVVWVDLAEGTDGSAVLTEVFGLHPLTVEDVFQVSQPKVEEHQDYVYLILHGVHPTKRSPRNLATVEVDVIVGARWVVTHHQGPAQSIAEVHDALSRGETRLLEEGPFHLAHAIADQLIDPYLPLMDSFDTEIDTLESDVFRNPRPELLTEIFELKHSLQRILRLGVHQRELLRRLSSGSVPRVPRELLPFFRDVDDHFLRTMDLAESYRQMVDTALDAHLSMQSHRMNEVMRVLTVISTVMLPLTFITGLYGMNFDHIPELHWSLGYPFVWGLMVVTSGTLLVYFRRKGWF